MLFIESLLELETINIFYLNFVADALIYVRNFILYIGFWLFGYIVVCCFVYRRYARKLPTRTRGSLGAKRVLLIVAHPDDECMFFGPTIFRLCEQGAEVYILCLSNADALIYVRNFILYIGFWLFGYIVVCCFVYRRYARKLPTRTRGSLGAKRVLLIVAHPDDECMFFGPTIFRLCEQGAEVYILCLSNGNFEGKGNVRATELWKACTELGVPESNIILINDTRLPDSPKTHWPVPVVAKLIQHHLEAYDIDTLVTFDRGGISGHPNHSAAFYAVAYIFVEKNMPQKCTVYTLDSVNIIRKYLGVLDLPLSFILSSKRYFLRWTESRRVVRAMKHHKSQMVWFRYLYVMFSRYMVINTLRRISLADIELELEVDV